MSIVTIGITACYKSDLERFDRMLLSLFDEMATPDMLSTKTSAESYASHIQNIQISDLSKFKFINVSRPVEVVVFVDCMDETSLPVVKYVYSSIGVIATHVSNVKFRIIHSNENIKLSAARNVIIQLSTSEYITFKDDDDTSININEIVRIIESNPNALVIEGYEIDTNKSAECLPIISMGPVTIICNRQFLIDHSLGFVVDCGNEDVIWRNDIYHVIETLPSTNDKPLACMTPNTVYLYWTASQRANVFNSNPDDIKSYIESIMNSDAVAYKLIDTVVTHERKMHAPHLIPVFPRFFKTTNKFCPKCHGMSVIRDYIMKHKGFFEFREYVDLCARVVGRIPFDKIPTEYKDDCFFMFCVFSSLADLYQLSKALHANVNETDDESIIETLHVMLSSHDVYKHCSRMLNNFRDQYLEEFAYKFVCLLFIRNNIDKTKTKSLLPRVDLSVLHNIRNYIITYASRVPLAEIFWLIHLYYSRLSKHHRLVDHNLDPYTACVKFMRSMGTINVSGRSNTMFHQLIDILSKEIGYSNVEDIKDGIKFYSDRLDITTYGVKSKRVAATHVDVFMMILLAPRVRTNSLSYSQTSVDRSMSTIKVVEVDKQPIEYTVTRGLYGKKSSMSGGNADIPSNDKLKNIIILLCVACVVVIVVIVVVIVVLKVTRHSNETSN